MHSFVRSFIHSGYLYITPSRNLLRGANTRSPITLPPLYPQRGCLKGNLCRRGSGIGVYKGMDSEFTLPSQINLFMVYNSIECIKMRRKVSGDNWKSKPSDICFWIWFESMQMPEGNNISRPTYKFSYCPHNSICDIINKPR